MPLRKCGNLEEIGNVICLYWGKRHEKEGIQASNFNSPLKKSEKLIVKT